METIEKIQYKNHTINIFVDENSDNPRNWDNIDKMVCQYKRYDLGDEQYESEQANSWFEWFAYYVLEEYKPQIKLKEYETNGYFDDEGKECAKVWKWINKNFEIQKLSLYDHSGITLSHCSLDSVISGFDCGVVGFHYIAKKDVLALLGGKKYTKKVQNEAIQILTSKLETYDNYLRGDVYGHTIEKDGKELGSCWGYYGDDHTKSGLLESAEYYINN